MCARCTSYDVDGFMAFSSSLLYLFMFLATWRMNSCCRIYPYKIDFEDAVSYLK